jgi:hypothetical protein
MKNVFIIAALLSCGAIAEAKTSSKHLTCDQAIALVESKGAVVLYTGKYTYDRYVAHGGYCVSGEITQPAYVPTLDDDACFVGYTCVQHSGNH